MSQKQSALDVSGLSRPDHPSAESVAEIVRVLGLSQSQAHELQILIDHFLADVDADLQQLSRLAPRPERARRLRRIEKALRRVQYEVEKSGELLDELLPFDLSQKLGRKLTFTAIGEAIGTPVAPRQFDYAMRSLLERESPLSMQAIDETFEAERESLGINHPGAVFRSMIEDLYEPLGQWVKLDKRRPGRKALRFRNLLVERLAEASNDVLGEPATSTANGRFVQLCSAVLDAMAISSEGVENAVEGAVKALKQRAEGEKVAVGQGEEGPPS